MNPDNTITFVDPEQSQILVDLYRLGRLRKIIKRIKRRIRAKCDAAPGQPIPVGIPLRRCQRLIIATNQIVVDAGNRMAYRCSAPLVTSHSPLTTGL